MKNHPRIPEFLHPNLQFLEIAERNGVGPPARPAVLPPPHAAFCRHLTDDLRACLAWAERENRNRIATRDRSRLGGLTGGRGRAKPSDRLPISSVAKQSGETVGGTEMFSVPDTFVSLTRVKTIPSRQPLAKRHCCS